MLVFSRFNRNVGILRFNQYDMIIHDIDIYIYINRCIHKSMCDLTCAILFDFRFWMWEKIVLSEESSASA